MKIPFDSLTLRAVTEELRRELVGGHVQHVHQHSNTDLLLTIRNRGSNHTLCLSCDAAFARVHLTHIKRPNPTVPPAFCMMCRKHMDGGHITDIHQVEFDRILEIDVERAGVSCTLIAEMMGKHSNLILVSASGMVLDAAKRITRKVSRHREVRPGVPYVPPPSQPGKVDPFSKVRKEVDSIDVGGDAEAAEARLMAHFQGISPFLAAEIVTRAKVAPLTEVWDELIPQREGEWSPVVIRGEKQEPIGAYPFPSVQFPAGRQNARSDMNTALEHYYGIAIQRTALDAARQEMLTSINQAVKAREKKRDSLLRSLEEVGRTEVYKQTGELILANLAEIEPGAETVSVPDFYSTEDSSRIIEMNPAKSAKENAEIYFRRYRKSKDGAAVHREQLSITEQDIRNLAGAKSLAEDASDIEALRRLREELSRSSTLRERGDKAAPDTKKPDYGGKKIRTYHTPEGYEILVGENSEANDYLTLRVAGPSDIWLHVRAAASAHVVIRVKNKKEAVPKSVLQRAAILAAQHSPSKHSSVVAVDYTLKRFVRKPRGAPIGTVTIQNEKTMHVSPKEER